MSEPQIVVAGGGLAGCAAALACADAGARVTLLEARRRLGGATFSFQRDGLWFDNGQHVFLRCCTAYRQFIQRIGADGMVTLQRRLAMPVAHPERGIAWLRRGSLPAPWHLAASLARYRHLSLGDRLRVGRAALALRRLDLRDDSLDERTFAAWLRDQRQSPQAVAALWDLIVVPTLNLPSSEASLWLAAMVFQTGLLSDAGAADLGYATVPLGRAHGEQAAKALQAAGVEVRLDTQVTRLVVEGAGRVRAEASGTAVEADALILAVPHEQAGALLPPKAHASAKRFGELGAAPIVNLHVSYDRRVMHLPFVAVVGTPLQWVFDRSAQAGLPAGQYLAVSLSGAEETAHAPTDRLRERFLPELARLFPSAAGARVLGFFATREHRATFRQGPGTRQLRPGPTTNLPGLFLAGAWTDTGWPATMEGAVRSGVRAAREALVALGRTEGLPEEIAA